MLKPKFPLVSVNVLGKIVGFGLVLVVADMLVPSLYGSYLPIVITIAVLTLVGAVADLVIVPNLGNFKSLLLGFPAMAAIIWAVAKFFPNCNITLGWAIVLTLFIGPIEYLLHEMVLNSLD